MQTAYLNLLITLSFSFMCTHFNSVNGYQVYSNYLLETIEDSYEHIRRTFKFPRGSGFAIKMAFNFPYQTLTKFDSKLQFSHTIPFKWAKYYPQIGQKDRMDVVPGYYGDEELLPKLSTLGYSAQGKKSSGSSAKNNVSLSDAEKSELLFDEALKRDRLRSRIERMFIYKDLESFLDKMGIPGAPCLLRTICEVAEEPLDESLFGEVLNTLLAASLGGRPEYSGENQDYNKYVDAEIQGKTSGNCQEKYSDCQNSVFSLFHSLLEDFFA